VCDLIGTIGSGWLSDRYDNRFLLGMYYGLRGVSLIWLVYSNVSLVALMAFAIVYGLDFIATVREAHNREFRSRERARRLWLDIRSASGRRRHHGFLGGGQSRGCWNLRAGLPRSLSAGFERNCSPGYYVSRQLQLSLRLRPDPKGADCELEQNIAKHSESRNILTDHL
jgi:hypothetical protein